MKAMPLADSSAPGVETRRLMAALETKLFGEAVDPVHVGRFEVIARLGEGAMGVVYRARDPGLDREVAVKLIASRFTDEAGATSRLRREARALARLEHPNVVKVLDVGSHGAQLFVAMEKVDGGTLLDWAHAHPPGTPGRIAALRSLLDQAAAGLDAAHHAGVVHRDVKPHNMLLGSDGRLRLADFGLASTSIAQAPTDEGLADITLEGSIGESHAVVGTPAYMAPEQFDGFADARADQFSLCASFWEVAFGERPFSGTSIVALRDAIAEQPPRPPAQVRDVPSWLTRVLARGLAEDPRERFPSLDALRAALRRRRRTRGTIAASFLGVGGLLVVVVVSQKQDRCASPPVDLDLAWNADTQAEVRERFVAAVPDAGASAFGRVDAALRSYAADWRTVWSEACAATWHDGTQTEAALDVRMHCLARAEQSYAAVVDVLVHDELDDVVVARAAEAAERLPAPTSCEDAEAEAHAMPSDEAVRAEIDRLSGELDALLLFKFATGMPRELAKAREISAAADAIGYAPLQAEAGMALAEFLIVSRDREALDVLDRTSRVITQAQLHVAAVRCALMQGGATHTLEQGDRTRYMAYARSLAERIEDDALRERELERVHIVEAEHLIDEGEHAAALELLDPAAQYYETHDDPDSAFRLMGVYEQRGRAYMNLSRYGEAERDLRLALAQRMRLPQSNGHHEMTIRSLLGQIASETGRPDIAAAEFTALLPAVERSLGRRHPAYASTLGNAANMRLLSGDYEGGIADMRRALAVFEETATPGQDNRVLGRSNIAIYLRPLAEKMALHREACDLALEHHGADSEIYAIARSMYAYDLMRTGSPAEAIPIAEEALAVFERVGKDRKIVDMLSTLARAHTALGRAEEGLRLAERAVANSRARRGEDGTLGSELALAIALHGVHRDYEANVILARCESVAGTDRIGEYTPALEALRRELGQPVL